ncbi:hypothetical protein, partial [Caballeronia sp. INSB1]|uniref:hypothetical protein n=1 Tax=Caballeronia sp. INSB1 TaxID=2921751 RepID=UPI0020322A5C
MTVAEAANVLFFRFVVSSTSTQGESHEETYRRCHRSCFGPSSLLKYPLRESSGQEGQTLIQGIERH